MKTKVKLLAALIGALACCGRTVALAGHIAQMMPAWQLQQGDSARADGDWDLAATYYQSAVAIDPHNSVAHADLGWAFVHCGKMKHAAEEFKTALALHPHLSSAENGLDVTFGSQEKREATVDGDPNNINAKTTLAELLMDRKEIDQARGLAFSALKVNPQFGHAHCVLGRIEALEGNDAAATVDLRIAVRQDRNDDDAWAKLGDLAKKGGDDSTALKCYRNAVKAAPDHSEWHVKLADEMAKTGDEASAAKERAAAASEAALGSGS